MQNVEFASSLCSSKLLKALGRWLLDLAPGCETPFALSHWLLLLLVCNSSFSQSKFLLFLVNSSLCSWATTLIALGQSSFCSQFATPLVVGLQLLLVLVRAPFALGWQLFLFLVGNSSYSWLVALLASSLWFFLVIVQLFLLLVCSFRNHGQSSFCSWFATLIVIGLQFLLVLVRTLFGPGWQLLLLLIGSPSCSKLVNRLAIGL